MKVAFITLGCPKNLVDAEVMIALLEAAGHTFVPEVADADVAVVNTCSFIAAALEESSAVIDECLDLKTRGCLEAVVVTGCMPERLGRGLGRFGDAVDAVVGCSGVDRVADALAAVAEGRPFAVVGGSAFLYDHTTPRVRGTPSHLAFVKIAEGCDNRCSYCTIPSIRGPLRSREADSIVAEVEDLTEDGVKEISLIAQDTTAYGTDLARNEGLPALLRRLARTGVPWIRLLYSHPGHVTDELLSVIAEEEHVVPYVDLPVQHVADRILRAMGRGTDGEEVRSVLARARERIHRVAIRSSVMVGFPGETDAEFEELFELVAAGAFDHLGVFEFSPERGTRAHALAPRVPRELASARAELLIQTMEDLTARRARDRVGETVTVLADSERTARTAGQAWETDGVVLWETRGAPTPEAGAFATARITGAAGFDLTAEPLAAGPGESP